MSPALKGIFNDLSWGMKIKLLETTETQPIGRKVGIEALTLAKRQNSPPAPQMTLDEYEANEIKMKIFRLMQESIADSEAKIQKAEIIKKHYENQTSFNVGYIMGDGSERIKIMTEISIAVDKMSREWTPLELINAYEMAVTKGIEINNLVELVKGIMLADAQSVPKLNTNF